MIADAPLLLWVGGLILAYVGMANFLWWIRPTAWRRSPYGRAVFQLGRFLYYVVVPYLALGGWHPRVLGWQSQQGLLALEDLGLVGWSRQWPATRWLEAAGTGLALGLLALLLLWLAWAAASRVSPAAPCDAALSFARRPWWAVLVGGLYLEVHWAFYRGGLAVALGDIYAGVFWGLAAACLEWTLNPFWRAGWQTAAQAGQVWLNTGLALTSALLFLLTRNLWICLAVHGLLALTFWALARHQHDPVLGRLSLPGLPSGGAASSQDKKGARGHKPAP
jgi:hypothetical protein